MTLRLAFMGTPPFAVPTLAELIGQGHDLMLGTRDPNKLDDKKMFGATLREWKSQTADRAKIATFKEAAAHGELLINATVSQGGSASGAERRRPLPRAAAFSVIRRARVISLGPPLR